MTGLKFSFLQREFRDSEEDADDSLESAEIQVEAIAKEGKEKSASKRKWKEDATSGDSKGDLTKKKEEITKQCLHCFEV